VPGEPVTLSNDFESPKKLTPKPVGFGVKGLRFISLISEQVQISG